MAVTTEQGIICPGNTVKPLFAHHLPLGALEGKTYACIPCCRVDAHLVGTMLGARSIRGMIQANKTEQEPNHLLSIIGAKYQAAIMRQGDKQMRRHNIS